jgi:hypothetical protein
MILRNAALTALLCASASALVQTTNPVPVSSSADLAFAAAQSDLHVASNGPNQYALWEDESHRWFGIELARDGKPIVSTQRLLDQTAFDVTSIGSDFFTLTGDAHSLFVNRIGPDGRMLSAATASGERDRRRADDERHAALRNLAEQRRLDSSHRARSHAELHRE